MKLSIATKTVSFGREKGDTVGKTGPLVPLKKNYLLVEDRTLWYNKSWARTISPRPISYRESTHFMEISWLGHSCFQLRGKNIVLITDPFTPQQDSSQGD